MTSASMIQKKNQDIKMGFSLLFFSYVGYKALKIKKIEKHGDPLQRQLEHSKSPLQLNLWDTLLPVMHGA